MSMVSFVHSFTFEGHSIDTCAIEEFGYMWLLETIHVFWNINVTCQLFFLRQILEREVRDKDKVFFDIQSSLRLSENF